MKKALNICRAWYTSSVIVSVISVEETDNVRVSEVLNMSVIYKLIEENLRAILLQKKLQRSLDCISYVYGVQNKRMII